MKKFELIQAVAKKTGLSQANVEQMLNATVETIVETCVDKGDEVNLPGLGKFKQKINPAKEGINPLTKKPMSVPESHTLKFTTSSSVKKVVEKTTKKGKKK